MAKLRMFVFKLSALITVIALFFVEVSNGGKELALVNQLRPLGRGAWMTQID
jgi:hypothetical protein